MRVNHPAASYGVAAPENDEFVCELESEHLIMKGIIAAGSPPTAEAGAEILRAGGNAVDAIVAAAFASFTAEASISSMGGGGFALVQSDTVKPVLYDFFVAMPGLGLADRQARLNSMDFRPVPVSFADKEETYYVGRGSTAVPGNPAGLTRLLAEHGSMPLSEVLQPGIRLARAGLPLPEGQDEVIASIKNVLLDTPESVEIFGRDADTLKQAGDHLANPAFADTLEHVAQHGSHDFYHGELAQALVDDHAQHGGLITADDLAAYQVIERQPLAYTYRTHRVYTNPPPSSGGILIAYALRLLEQADLGDYEFHSVDHIRLLTEIMRQASIVRYRDRPAQLVDDWQRFLDSDIAGDWAAVQERLTGSAAERLAVPADGDTRSTTHLSAVDANGLAVGITLTPGATGGYVVGDTGMLTNNILGEIDLNPQGFHQQPAGTRLTSMMAPTVVDTGRGRRFVVGSAGSSRIRSAILQVMSNLLDWRLPLDEAVNRARVHFHRNVLDLEYGYQKDVADALDAGGYIVNPWREMNLYFGGAHVALQNQTGDFSGAGDVRRGGYCVRVD
jgi:gamma-glutamyltranspeptidase/glutathione hydrolase